MSERMDRRAPASTFLTHYFGRGTVAPLNRRHGSQMP